MRIQPQQDRDRDKEKEREGRRVSIGVPRKRSGMVAFSLFVFCSLILIVQPSYSSSAQSLTSNPDFDHDINLFGDAQVVSDNSGGSHVKLTRPSPLTAGLLLRRSPIKFSDPISLSVEFSFSISSDAGEGLLLILVPGDFASAFPGNGSYGLSSPKNSFLGVEFDTSKDDKVNDPNANHVGIDVGSLVSVAVANVSAVNLVLNSGEKLKAWVDYEAGSNTLEVRLNKYNEPRSSNPIVSHNIDLFKIWGDKSVFVGLSSSNDAGSSQVVSVYSWKLSLKKVSKSLHSQPADPKDFSVDETRKSPLNVLAGVIFGTVCVALVTFVVLFMWAIFFQKREEESLVKMTDQGADVRGYSPGEITSDYVRNLPADVTEDEIDQECKNFGRIKPDGIFVRVRKEFGLCYAFVEFEDITSVQNALQALMRLSALFEERGEAYANANARVSLEIFS